MKRIMEPFDEKKRKRHKFRDNVDTVAVENQKSGDLDVVECVPEDVWSFIFQKSFLKLVLSFGGSSKYFHRLSDRYIVVAYPHLACYSDGFLRKFTHLTRLKIISTTWTGDNITDAGLSLLTNLQHLSVPLTRQNYNLSALTNLQRLKWKTWHPLNSLHRLCNLTFLCSNVVPSDLELLTNLRELRLTRSCPPENIDHLTTCTNLTRLRVKNLVEIPRGLGRLTSLVCLNFECHDERFDKVPYHANFESVDITGLNSDPSYLTRLRDIVIQASPAYYPMVDIPLSLTTLERLDCNHTNVWKPAYSDAFPKLTSLKNIGHFKDSLLPVTLEKLSTSVATRTERFNHLTNLRSLDYKIWNRDASFISCLTNLTKLKIANGKTLSFPSLTALTSLTDLQAKTHTVPDDVIEHLPNLTRLVRLAGEHVTPGRFAVLETVLGLEGSEDSRDEYFMGSEDEVDSEPIADEDNDYDLY